jgi:hypothetical protein
VLCSGTGVKTNSEDVAGARPDEYQLLTPTLPPLLLLLPLPLLLLLLLLLQGAARCGADV